MRRQVLRSAPNAGRAEFRTTTATSASRARKASTRAGTGRLARSVRRALARAWAPTHARCATRARSRRTDWSAKTAARAWCRPGARPSVHTTAVRVTTYRADRWSASPAERARASTVCSRPASTAIPASSPPKPPSTAPDVPTVTCRASAAAIARNASLGRCPTRRKKLASSVSQGPLRRPEMPTAAQHRSDGSPALVPAKPKSAAKALFRTTAVRTARNARPPTSLSPAMRSAADATPTRSPALAPVPVLSAMAASSRPLIDLVARYASRGPFRLRARPRVQSAGRGRTPAEERRDAKRARVDPCPHRTSPAAASAMLERPQGLAARAAPTARLAASRNGAAPCALFAQTARRPTESVRAASPARVESSRRLEPSARSVHLATPPLQGPRGAPRVPMAACRCRMARVASRAPEEATRRKGPPANRAPSATSPPSGRPSARCARPATARR